MPEQNKGLAVIVAGSDSDKEHIIKLRKALESYEIPHQTRIVSAHKQPDQVLDILKRYEELREPYAFISVAGGTDALSGTLSFHAYGMVIACPPDSPNDSCLRNPPGSSNATIYRPENVARFIAQAFSHHHPGYREILSKNKLDKRTKLMDADERALRGEL